MQSLLQSGGKQSERIIFFDEVVEPGIWLGQPASVSSDWFFVFDNIQSAVVLASRRELLSGVQMCPVNCPSLRSHQSAALFCCFLLQLIA